MPERVLVVGGGAREHAICWRLVRDPEAPAVLALPGNPGIAELAQLLPGDAGSPDAILALAAGHRADLTVIGPEVPLGLGVVDRFAAAGRPVVGPTRAAARLETSKAFAKQFMTRHRVPTARYRVCDTPEDATRAIDEFGAPVVIKADGLAAGKGVVVALERETALAAVNGAMIARQFGDAGLSVVVEEFLEGTEASFFVLTDGTRALTLTSAQDHKRAYDGDQGPNTGGMGAFAPTPRITPELEVRILKEIVEPVLAGMRAEGAPYRGFLYVGLMLTGTGPRVIEFNVRLGDPEAQVVLPLLDEPLLPLLHAAATGHLEQRHARTSSQPHVGVVVASGGYPGTFERGRLITGLDTFTDDDPVVFHAGTRRDGDRLVTDGGRVLSVVGRGRDFPSAIAHAYSGVRRIHFEGMHYRRDIGRTAMLSL
ncbi:MAG: phosphoribosylamine--glycine ligase [Vicinamibacteraceae bacterium]|nr:phosphoribosylamine--glycine ligase [Vicinamibacteraceae bacterium]